MPGVRHSVVREGNRRNKHQADLHMSQEKDKVPEEFYDVVDQFINLANRLAKEQSSGRISATILYAASRYNAFYFHATDPNVEKNKEDAVEYYCEQYKKMLLDNLDELAANASSGERKE